MSDLIIELVLAERNWLPFAMSVAIVTVAVMVGRSRPQQLPWRLKILWGMNLFFGVMIGIMAIGHLLAVTIKVTQGTLDPSRLPLYLLVPIGVALAIPAWWLVGLVGRFPEGEWGIGKKVRGLNVWLALFLAALGLHNLPLALPAGLNLAYQFHSRRWVGWTILAVASAGYLMLFIGSLIFMASGQSFEQFSGAE